MDWQEKAKTLFKASKPDHFTNYQHCCECAEHDETLRSYDVDSIGLEQLGNPGWDPLCFSSTEGMLYYMPALIRLTLETLTDAHQTYLDQLLFHLIRDGNDNSLVTACSKEQKAFVAEFLEHLIDNYGSQIDAGTYFTDDIVRAHEIWSSND